ncbi:hypothetical protein [Paenibacillus selenitireducens]|uniref:hypothetical protein n=1 Tax=Paenibacillus selenitireducens TaxID=1324314 RepID=UPI00267BFBA1
MLDFKWHKEHEGIQLIWKSIDELASKPLYPEGILEIIEKKNLDEQSRMIIRKTY